VIVAVPADTAVTRPVLLTVAEGELEIHVRSLFDASFGATVAVN
jgi:hypothetical protein